MIPLSKYDTIIDLFSFNAIAKPFQSMHLPHVLHVMSQREDKIQKFKITDRKDVKRQGSTDNCGVFVLEYIIFREAYISNSTK